MKIRLVQKLGPPGKYKEYYTIWWDDARVGKIYVKFEEPTTMIHNKRMMSISVNKAYQGKGIGLEAVKQFMAQTKSPHVYALTRKGNLAMNRILRKLGWKITTGSAQNLYHWRKSWAGSE